jgi:hypothetical protein
VARWSEFIPVINWCQYHSDKFLDNFDKLIIYCVFFRPQKSPLKAGSVSGSGAGQPQISRSTLKMQVDACEG